jgi:hypothetical protein
MSDMPPPEIEEIIRKLPLRVGLYVPDDILEEWFPPGVRDGTLTEPTRGAVQDYAKRVGCEFEYYPDRGEGVFWKWVPAM